MSVLLLISTVLIAQGPGFQGRNFNKPANCKDTGCCILNLSQEQQQKMNELIIKHLKEITPLKNELKEKRARLRTLETVDKPDVNAINKTIEEIGSLQTQLMKKKSAHRLEVLSLLTDEQKVIYNSYGNKKGMKNFGSKGNLGFGRENCPFTN